MLKWAEFTEAETLYEAFLPESDKEGVSWLLRAIRRGHIVAERRIAMIYRPMFGPDMGDVAALEAATDRLVEELQQVEPPEGIGGYSPSAVEVDSPDPALHATLYSILETFPSAAKALGIDVEAISDLLRLPSGWVSEDLYPVAVTRQRCTRMRQIIALNTLVERHSQLRERLSVLVGAIRRDDVPALERELAAAGIQRASPSSTE